MREAIEAFIKTMAEQGADSTDVDELPVIAGSIRAASEALLTVQNVQLQDRMNELHEAQHRDEATPSKPKPGFLN